MLKKYFTLIIITLGFFSNLSAQKDNETFTIYLVRHSEKESETNNPPLTKCGEQRSEYLKEFLSDVHLDAVYSTDYVRTKSTALPTAKSKKLDIIDYDPGNLKKFSNQLIASNQDALVVGHSNTTGVLAGILTNQELGEFDLHIYDRIYQVVIYKNKGRLHLLHSAFNCNN